MYICFYINIYTQIYAVNILDKGICIFTSMSMYAKRVSMSIQRYTCRYTYPYVYICVYVCKHVSTRIQRYTCRCVGMHALRSRGIVRFTSGGCEVCTLDCRYLSYAWLHYTKRSHILGLPIGFPGAERCKCWEGAGP